MSTKIEENIPLGSIDEIEAIKKLNLPLTENFRRIVIEERPLLDVRASIEFEKGAFPQSTNLPLINNKERHLIGIRYKKEGNASAVALGKELVAPLKNNRVQAWVNFIKENPNVYLYCFRGGQRSQISQAWIEERGLSIPRLKGGYKAFRQFLMQQSEEITNKLNTIIIGGRTGSGKTLLLHKLKNSIDLEGMANHRGSSFGGFTTPQPTQIDFENRVAYALIKHQAKGYKNIIIEDESRNIGHINIPKPIYDNLHKGKMILLETPLKERIDITFDEYVTQALVNYNIKYGDKGQEQWFNDANRGLERIKKRLGTERYKKINQAFIEAFSIQKESGKLTQHKEWIEILLQEYYDPMYDYQIEKSQMDIVFKGNTVEILDYLNLKKVSSLNI